MSNTRLTHHYTENLQSYQLIYIEYTHSECWTYRIVIWPAFAGIFNTSAFAEQGEYDLESLSAREFKTKWGTFLGFLWVSSSIGIRDSAYLCIPLAIVADPRAWIPRMGMDPRIDYVTSELGESLPSVSFHACSSVTTTSKEPRGLALAAW